MAGTNDLLLEVSSIPPVDFGRRLRYLIQYPHGCIEQITSAAFPQIFLRDVVELNSELIQKTENNVKAGIKNLAGFQLQNGAFSYWPGSIRESSWGTSYAGHFLLEAQQKGYYVPTEMIRSWQKYQKKAARQWSIIGSANIYEIGQEQILQAYRLFTLALAGEAEMGSMNRLRERTDLIPEAKWRLAAAYALAGHKETAVDLISNVSIDVMDYNDSRFSFGSSTRDRAMILEAMVIIGMKENGFLLLEKIARELSSQQWMSTQTTAYSLIAIAKFSGGNSADKRISFEYTFNGSEMKKAETGMAVAQLYFEPGNDQKGEIKVRNVTGDLLYIRIANTGLPKPGNEMAVAENLNLEAYYTNLEGTRIRPENIQQGSDFYAVYKIYNPGLMGHLENVALTTIFPSGWEIHNERLFNGSGSNNAYTYQDIRDDRVMTYFSLSANSSKTFTIRLNAAYKGGYYLPSVLAEEMYKKDVRAVIPGRWIEVPALY
jgi:uncharacterized protein YfaS (alpha-2-macroglobulin family)